MRISTFLVAMVFAGSVTAAHAGVIHRRDGLVPGDDDASISLEYSATLRAEHASLVLRPDGALIRASLRLVLGTAFEFRPDQSILIGVPHGTRAHGLAVTIGDVREEAQLVDANAAKDTYRRTVARNVDPALLEWVGATPQRIWFRLRVFPVTPDSWATVELELVLPRLSELALDPGDHRVHASVDLDGVITSVRRLTTPLMISIPDAPDPIVDDAPPIAHVDPRRSLYAGPGIVLARREAPIEIGPDER